MKEAKLQLQQERLGLEEALRLQEQLDEEERQRIARVHEEASTFNAEEWDNIQAQIEANEELAHREGSEPAEESKDELLKNTTIANDHNSKLNWKSSELGITQEPTEDKERGLWVELKRLFEPDDDDTL
ncbi:hypothetical protein Tco_1393446 [Tanacetum coccineum]